MTIINKDTQDVRPHMAFEVIEALEKAGYDGHAYSGRSMYGRQCYSIRIDEFGELFRIGQALPEDDGLPIPKYDNMGRGYVVYWPGFRMPTDAEWAEYHAEMGTDTSVLIP